MQRKFTKQPGETLDYDFDFGLWMPEADAVQSSLDTSVITISPSGLTAGTKVHDTTEHIVKQWLSGGTTGVDYTMTCTLTTAQGRIKEAEMIIQVRELNA